jgi:hypothetical protein
MFSEPECIPLSAFNIPPSGNAYGQKGSVTGSASRAGYPARRKKVLRFFAYGELE